MNNPVSDDEKLYRSISTKHVTKNNKIAYAAFIDSNGLSVDRDGGREENSIIKNLSIRFKKNSAFIVKLIASQCFDCEAVVKPSPSKNNKFHAEIHSSNTVVELSPKQAMLLNRCCRIIENNNNLN